jgi:ribosomal protein S18 acetylase RimI-like enzyme
MPEPEILIRIYQTSDEEQVVGLWQDCGLVVSWNDPRQDIARKLAVQPDLFWIAESGDRLVGTIMVGYEGHRGWINYLAVAPDHQRLSIGRRMMQRAEDELRKLGCPKINLQVRTSNQQVITFYQRLGFKVDDVMSLGKRL